MRRSQFPTAAALRVLRAIKSEDDPDADAAIHSVTQCGKGWYVGIRHISSETAHDLLSMCLIRQDANREDERFQYYWKTPEGKRVETDPDYVPRILRSMAGEDVSQETP